MAYCCCEFTDRERRWYTIAVDFQTLWALSSFVMSLYRLTTDGHLSSSNLQGDVLVSQLQKLQDTTSLGDLHFCHQSQRCRYLIKLSVYLVLQISIYITSPYLYLNPSHCSSPSNSIPFTSPSLLHHYNLYISHTCSCPAGV